MDQPEQSQQRGTSAAAKSAGVPDIDFEPAYFAHGRLLWRFEGSDAVRFSPRVAWDVVADVARLSAGAGWLWDPFAGAGLIPAVALAFFPEAFAGVAASDVSAAAAKAAKRNLDLVSEPSVAQQRLDQVRGLRGQNPKSDRRWGEVEGYLTRLMPRIGRVSAFARKKRVACALAHEYLASLANDDSVAPSLHIVSDAPYGRGVELVGPPLESVARSWIEHPAVASVALVCTPEQAETLGALPESTLSSAKGGRARWSFSRTRS